MVDALAAVPAGWQRAFIQLWVLARDIWPEGHPHFTDAIQAIAHTSEAELEIVNHLPMCEQQALLRRLGGAC